MTPELRPITRLTVASTTALFVLAAPLAVDWRTLDIDAMRAAAQSDGGRNSGDGGGLGGAVDGAVGAVGDAADGAADAAADGVSDAVGGDSGSDQAGTGSGSGETSSGSGSGEASSGSGSGETSSGSGSGETTSGSGSGDATGDAAAADADGGSAPAEAADGAAPTDGASSADSVAESGEVAEPGDGDVAPDVADTVSDAVAPAAEVADGIVDAISESASAVATDAAIASSTAGSIAAPGAAGKAVVSQTRVTVSVVTVRLRPTRGDGDGGEKHRLVGSSPAAATAIVELPPDDGSAAVAGIEPSAGPVFPAAPPPAMSAASCTAGDGRQQGTEVSCLVVGSGSEVRTRQIAYAPSDGAVDDGTPDAPLAPSIDKVPGDPGVYDELYGLQQVEARRYTDGNMPVLIVQGIVSNMSNGQRSVPPLLAIVQDEQGKELLRWTFRAEAETLGPGGSTGFRSEMFDPQSESAKVTIVFAAEQQAMP